MTVGNLAQANAAALEPYQTLDPGPHRSSFTLTSGSSIRENEDSNANGMRGCREIVQVKAMKGVTSGEGHRDLRTLSERGYGSLAVCATFLAAMQGQVLSLVVGNGAIQYPLASALFFLGLLANVFGAILSYEAARWFEMLTEDEAAFSEQCMVKYTASDGVEHDGGGSDGLGYGVQAEVQPSTGSIVDSWITISIAAGPYLVMLGIISFILGLVLYIFRTQGVVTKAVLATFTVLCAVLFPPFVLRHNRYWVLKHLRLERRSDVGLSGTLYPFDFNSKARRSDTMGLRVISNDAGAMV